MPILATHLPSLIPKQLTSLNETVLHKKYSDARNTLVFTLVYPVCLFSISKGGCGLILLILWEFSYPMFKQFKCWSVNCICIFRPHFQNNNMVRNQTWMTESRKALFGAFNCAKVDLTFQISKSVALNLEPSAPPKRRKRRQIAGSSWLIFKNKSPGISWIHQNENALARFKAF